MVSGNKVAGTRSKYTQILIDQNNKFNILSETYFVKVFLEYIFKEYV